jgi:hypothetical protein
LDLPDNYLSRKSYGRDGEIFKNRFREIIHLLWVVNYLIYLSVENQKNWLKADCLQPVSVKFPGSLVAGIQWWEEQVLLKKQNWHQSRAISSRCVYTQEIAKASLLE